MVRLVASSLRRAHSSFHDESPNDEESGAKTTPPTSSASATAFKNSASSSGLHQSSSSVRTNWRRGGRNGKNLPRSEALRKERSTRLISKLSQGISHSSSSRLSWSLRRSSSVALHNHSAASTVDANTSVVRPTFNDEDDRERLIAEKEDRAHDASEHNAIALFVLNMVASAKVFCRHLITINTVFGVALTVAAILLVYFRSVKSGNVYHGRMDWVLLGFSVVLPLSATVRFAFTRREQALRAIAEFKSNALHIYMAHASWDWDKSGVKGSGRAGVHNEDWLQHSDAVFEELICIGDELFRYLTLPTSSQGRHRSLQSGRREAAITAEASYLMFDSLLAIRATRLSRKAEELKRMGLAATEASRIRQWERYMCKSIEEMRMIKSYRTPQALRSFANLFTLLLPPFYASSYVDLAYQVNSLTIGIIFGVITSIALTALYESVQVLEDPFVAHLSLDGIDVQEELCVLHWRQLVNARKVYFPSAPHAFIALDEMYSAHHADEEKGSRNKRTRDVLSRSNMSHNRTSVFLRDLPREQRDAMNSTLNAYLELPLRRDTGKSVIPGEATGEHSEPNPPESPGREFGSRHSCRTVKTRPKQSMGHSNPIAAADPKHAQNESDAHAQTLERAEEGTIDTERQNFQFTESTRTKSISSHSTTIDTNSGTLELVATMPV